MGCAVNGPGEAGDADFGIAGGRDVGFIYAHGRVLKKVSSETLIDELFREIDAWIAAGMQPAEAAEDGEAGGARNGGGVARFRSTRSLGADGAPGLPALPPDPSRRPRGRRGGQPQAARARRLHPAGERRRLDVPAARLAGAREGRPDHPRGDGRDRLAGDADAGPDAGRALAGDRPLRVAGGLQASGPQRPRVRAPADARGDGHLPRARDPVVPRPAADALPLPDEGSRRAAAARGPDPRPRVHHEGLVLVRPRRGRARPQLPLHKGAYDRIFERCGLEIYLVAGRVGDDGRQRERGLPRAGRDGREHTRHLRARRLRGRPGDRARRSRVRRSSRRRSTRPTRSRRRAWRRSRTSPSCSASTRRRRRRRCPSSPTARSCSRSCAATTGSTRASCSRRSASPYRPATEEEIREAFGADPGSLGPVGTSVEVVADEALREGQFVAGANRTGYHLRGVEAGRDFEARFANIREVAGGRHVPEVRRRAALPDGDRGRPHLQARDALLRAARRDLPRRGREGEAARHGQLRHRAGPDDGGGRRAAPRRARHRVAA